MFIVKHLNRFRFTMIGIVFILNYVVTFISLFPLAFSCHLSGVLAWNRTNTARYKMSVLSVWIKKWCTPEPKANETKTTKSMILHKVALRFCWERRMQSTVFFSRDPLAIFKSINYNVQNHSIIPSKIYACTINSVQSSADQSQLYYSEWKHFALSLSPSLFLVLCVLFFHSFVRYVSSPYLHFTLSQTALSRLPSPSL